mmetsp:Transcript_19895/g.24558  ORF Transcript_19895/g.24558 Transcript_19895/m.24558 type:complete len:534 (+) Transcript_19895:114-1715(+)|eukprot:CAMPEP_0172518084 /NCGR_PEP_ID=MMETSP1066-20121228/290324_1 /TAXON_ID=671091 /ORGANISM="Coscinodiscus wailesii, Strain CCMP2513" /LENGTH=533 /DNA_ID=CAMNT_0013300387 /DNA_START=90 /DNA_END=1691 /DNA_ORIENTATION=+
MATPLAPWAVALITLAVVLIVFFIIKAIVKSIASRAYYNILKNPSTPLDTESFVGPANPPNCVKCVILHRFNVGSRKPSSNGLPLTSIPSPDVDNLRLSRALGDTNATERDPTDTLFAKDTPADLSPDKPVVVVGTIRMGFGHHRIAYSTASWSVDNASQTYFHDFLAIKSEEADLIKSTDALYSKGSRIASEWGGPVEKVWGGLMLGGDADALRAASLMAVHLRPLLASLPRNTPFIATHQLVALTAVAAGFTNVINLVIDNHPQWFITVPGALNLIQGPVNYQSFLNMGIPAENLQLAGHWCPRELVENIPKDCATRLARMKAKEPKRILIPVGGAGAQRKFIINFIHALAPKVRAGSVQLLLNGGDHKHMKVAFEKVLKEEDLDYETISTTAAVKEFQGKLLKGGSPSKNVTLFAFDDYFPAVATTDIMCRVADILACKPSELAFYPLPKLMVRRVGDHEADSARRASELGDGTIEARTIEDAMNFVRLFCDSDDLFTQMNEKVIKNNEQGIYDGCKQAVQIALEKMKKK